MSGLHLPLRALGRRWRADRRGAAAVEFAMVAGPLLFMIFALIELAIYFMVQVTLDSATAEAARELRTGHDASGATVIADGQQDTTGQQAFKTHICSNMSWLPQCSSNLTVDVRPLGSFSSTPGAIGSNGACFYSGSAGNAVELRTWYKWSLVTTALTSSLQTPGAGAGVTQLASAQAFQVEPNGQTQTSTSQC